MQQSHYNKINLIVLGLATFCTIIASLVAVFFLAPMMTFGGGPFGMGAPPNIPENVIQDLTDEIYAMESVTTFKETFPDFRETINEGYGVDYILQARNANTGNVLSLNINHHPIGPPGSSDKFQMNQHLQCIPGEGIFGSENQMMNMMRGMGGEDLFVHETIKSSNCLDDDWTPVVITDE